MENPELDARLVSALADPSALGEFVNGFLSSPLLVPMRMDDGTAYPISMHRADGAAFVVFTGERHSLQIDLPAANDVVVLNGARVIDLANPDRGVLVNPGPHELYLPIALVSHVQPQIPAQLLETPRDSDGDETASQQDPPAGSLQAVNQAQTALAGNAYRWLAQGGSFDTADFFVAFCGREHTARGTVVSAGQPTSIAVPDPMVGEFQVLRRAGADPEKGSWIGAGLHVTARARSRSPTSTTNDSTSVRRTPACIGRTPCRCRTWTRGEPSSHRRDEHRISSPDGRAERARSGRAAGSSAIRPLARRHRARRSSAVLRKRQPPCTVPRSTSW